MGAAQLRVRSDSAGPDAPIAKMVGMRCAVIIPAAGASLRFGGRPKIDEDLGGRPVLQRTVELFTGRDDTGLVVVAAPRDGFEEFCLRHADRLTLIGAVVCKGGKAHRYESVKHALEFAKAEHAEPWRACTHVAVHDAARPAASPELIGRVLAAAASFPAVVPGVEVADTIKRVGEEIRDRTADPLAAILGAPGVGAGAARPIEETVSRAGLMLVQTPQVFERELFERAYAQADLSSTDDAQLVERLGERVVIVEGDPRNIKITRPADISLTRSIMGLKGPMEREAHKRF